MTNIFTSWKTTSAGMLAILAALSDILGFAAQKQLTPHLMEDIGTIAAGLVGLFAKDASVTNSPISVASHASGHQ